MKPKKKTETISFDVDFFVFVFGLATYNLCMTARTFFLDDFSDDDDGMIDDFFYISLMLVLKYINETLVVQPEYLALGSSWIPGLLSSSSLRCLPSSRLLTSS
jgi:hypothetical protein